MKKVVLFIIIALSASSMNSYGQAYTTDVAFHMPFDSSYVVGVGVVDSFDINQTQGYTSGQFVVCANSIFTFKGNQSSSNPSFYLFPGATLILKDSYFYPQVYMSNMSVLNAKGGNQNIICYREASTILQDTSNVNWFTDSIVTSMSFTFANWPNASSPCSLSPPQSVNDFTNLDASLFVQHRSLNYTIDTEQKANLSVYDLCGKELVAKEIESAGQLNLEHLANGIYLVRIAQKGKVYKQKIFLD